MKIKAIIVDDEQDAREILEFIVDKYCPDVELIGSASNADEAYKIILEKRPELLLLDIRIAGETSTDNSFDLLKKLPKYKYEIIFVTAYDKYAIQAIKAHAFDYLLKPVNIMELVNAIEGVKDSLKQEVTADRLAELISSFDNETEKESVWIHSLEGHKKVNLEDIIRIQSLEQYSEIITTNTKMFSKANLKTLAGILPENKFFHIHRSHIVNSLHVKEIKKDDWEYLLTTDNEKISIPRRKRSDFMKFLKIDNV